MNENGQTNGVRAQSRAYALALLRAVVGVIMVTHGWMKLTDIQGTAENFAGMGIPVPEASAYLAVAGELLGGLGILLGLVTPVAAFGVLCTMIVAIVFAHLPNGLLAQNGGFEYPLTMGVVALYLMVRGAGPVSLDAWLAKRRASKREVWTIPGQHPSSVTA